MTHANPHTASPRSTPVIRQRRYPEIEASYSVLHTSTPSAANFSDPPRRRRRSIGISSNHDGRRAARASPERPLGVDLRREHGSDPSDGGHPGHRNPSGPAAQARGPFAKCPHRRRPVRAAAGRRGRRQRGAQESLQQRTEARGHAGSVAEHPEERVETGAVGVPQEVDGVPGRAGFQEQRVQRRGGRGFLPVALLQFHFKG